MVLTLINLQFLFTERPIKADKIYSLGGIRPVFVIYFT
jgi:hypothetical protein